MTKYPAREPADQSPPPADDDAAVRGDGRRGTHTWPSCFVRIIIVVGPFHYARTHATATSPGDQGETNTTRLITALLLLLLLLYFRRNEFTRRPYPSARPRTHIVCSLGRRRRRRRVRHAHTYVRRRTRTHARTYVRTHARTHARTTPHARRRRRPDACLRTVTEFGPFRKRNSWIGVNVPNTKIPGPDGHRVVRARHRSV